MIAARSCEDCQKFMYLDVPGKPPATEPFMRGGLPVLRSPSQKPPCRYSDTPCPKGTPENQRTLSPLNVQVLEHYRECQATGQFPDDRIVRMNAGIIAETMRRLDQQRQQMMAIIAGGGKVG